MEEGINYRQQLHAWLTETVEHEKPAAGIVAFRFGLTETEESYVLYLAGHTKHDKDNYEWACYEPEFMAETELHFPIKDEQQWEWILLEVIRSLGWGLRTEVIDASFLGGEMPVYTGFVGGDLFRIK
ncbi:hypothetical protein GCM10023185_17520 [Hymenobacter saemangeumensis]|uniref:Uncharacterized protein n=1 Tax=Hymenobacter saemangeumensis TaxID=1084522 RepID=A0ABP8IBD6_9BACT